LVLRLAVHCGCMPRDILQMRDTQSWGEIAVAQGSDWGSVMAEAQGMAAAAGLTAAPARPEEIERVLANHPLLSPVPTPRPYSPLGGGSCP
jgi:hypothetical protein